MSEFKNKNILIYLPLKKYGGTEILFNRLISYLILKFNVYVYVGDNSLSRISINDKAIILSCVDDLVKQQYTVIIASAKYLNELACISNQLLFNKLILWQLHPDELCSPIFKYISELKVLGDKYKNIRHLFINIFYFKRKVEFKRLISHLASDKSIFVMDGSCAISNTEWLSLKNGVIDNYLPVGVFVDNGLNRIEKKEIDIINVGIVSRISYDFKYYPILNVIQNLKLISKNEKFKFRINIVGDGDALNDLIEETKHLNSIDFEIIFIGFIPVELLKDKFYSNIDISIGMGTSVLDSSSCGVPTILTNFYSRYLNPEKIKYSWLYSQKQFSLGSEYNIKDCGSGLNELLHQFLDDPIKHSKKSFDYVAHNHNLTKIFDEIRCEIDSVDSLSDSSPILEHAYSIMNYNVKSEKFINWAYQLYKKCRVIIFGK